MNKKLINQQDPLQRYMNKKLAEKAPEGFTSRVMSLVQLEKVPVAEPSGYEKMRIPIFSGVIIVVLMSLAIITGGENETLKIPEIFKGINLTFPDFSSIFSINLPSTLTYALVGLLVLTLFDVLLKAVFRR